MIRYELELSDAKVRRATPHIFTQIKDRNERNDRVRNYRKKKMIILEKSNNYS